MKTRKEREARVLELLEAYREGASIRYKGRPTGSRKPWEKLSASLAYLTGNIEHYSADDPNEAAIRTQIAMLEAQLREYRGEIL